MKFLLVVIYGSSGRHSISSKSFKKDPKKWKYIFMTILGLAESLRVSKANEVPTSSHIYGSPRRHSDSLKALKKSEKMKKSFMTMLGL